MLKHLIFIALIAFVITQRAPSTIQNIVAGNYTVSINLKGGSFKILKNHEEEINFSPQFLVEKNLNGFPIANRSVDLSNKLFTVYEADYNKTHPVKYIRLTSENLNNVGNSTNTVFKTTITLHKNNKNVYFAQAPTGSFEISHQIENWKSCHNTGANTDKPECVDEEMRNLNETFIDFNMTINHPTFYSNETRMSFENDTIKLIGSEFEDFTFKDSYNIQPGKSIRPEWEEGYPMLVENIPTLTGSVSQMSFRFKKPVLHKYDNTLIWFNYLYNNNRPLITKVAINPTEIVSADMNLNQIDLFARNDFIFNLQFTHLTVKAADGLYYLNDSANLVGLKDKTFVLKRSEKTTYSTIQAQEIFGTIGNFLDNATIKVRVLGFEQDGNISALNGEKKEIHAGDVRVSVEVENFPFKNEGDSLELGLKLHHPNELKTLNESDDFIAKYAKGQIDIPRWIKTDNSNFCMSKDFPKISYDFERITEMNVNLGKFNKKSEFEMFLHPAKETELAPVRRYDSTNWQSNQGGNIKALADHNVECRDNEVLSFWNMKSRSNKISIEYYCISFLSVETKVEWKYTSWNGISSKQDKSVNHLDRHKLLCDSDESIGAWRMEKSGNYIRFKYRCNKTVNTSNDSRTTNWERVGEGQVQNLKEHYLFATSKEDTLKVLRGWKMSTKYTKKWCTFMCDDYQDIKFEIFYNTLRNYNEHM